MTRPSAKVTITPEMVERFAHYYARDESWGALHVSFADANWWCLGIPSVDATAEELAIVAIHDSLTESQRRRLRGKAETLRESWRGR